MIAAWKSLFENLLSPLSIVVWVTQLLHFRTPTLQLAWSWAFAGWICLLLLPLERKLGGEEQSWKSPKYYIFDLKLLNYLLYCASSTFVCPFCQSFTNIVCVVIQSSNRCVTYGYVCLPCRMVVVATDPATMKQLLLSEMPEEDLTAFSDEDLEILIKKKYVTASLLHHASLHSLEKPPGLETALADAVLRAFNPSALAASSGKPATSYPPSSFGQSLHLSHPSRDSMAIVLNSCNNRTNWHQIWTPFCTLRHAL